MGRAGDRKCAVVIVRYTDHPILLGIEFIRLNNPHTLRLWRLTECRCDGNLVAVYRLNRSALRRTGWKVEDQTVASSGISNPVQFDNPAIHRTNTPAGDLAG